MSLRLVLPLVLALVWTYALSRTPADPDLWGHVRFGQDMIAAGAVRLPDTYSFTSDRPWVNHEWLAEVAMAAAFNAGGPSGLNALRWLVIAAVLALVWRRLKPVDARDIRLLLVLAAGAGIFLRVYPVRPQLFSVLLFAVLVDRLASHARRQPPGAVIAVPLIMAAWVNLHGGWPLGLGTFGAWTAATIFAAPWDHRGNAKRVACLLLACLATLLNPYGAQMWRFLHATVGVQRPFIGDWQPLLHLPPAFWFSWLIPSGVAILAVARARARVPLSHWAIVAMLGSASILISRIDAFYALAVVMLLAPATFERRSTPAIEGDPHRIAQLRPRTVLAVAGTLALGTIVLRLPVIEVRSPLLPEPEAAAFIRTNALGGRMVTWFDWGQYAIWHLSPDITVSMDGRRETVYSEEQIAAHMRFYAGEPGAWRHPELLRADYVWLPRRLPVVPQLKADGWRAAFEGPVSIILVRSIEGGPRQVVTREAAAREFPGP